MNPALSGPEGAAKHQAEMAQRRLEVVGEVLACTRCPLRDGTLPPVPFRGPAPARMALVGEAPGWTELKKGQPFVGPAGTMLTRILVQAKVDPAAVAVLNINQCVPKKPAGGVRAPTTAEMGVCDPVYRMQLDLVDPEWMVLLGATALAKYRPDLKITRMRGTPMWWEDRWMMPTNHPASALGGRSPGNELLIIGDIRKVREWMGHGDGSPEPGKECAVCPVDDKQPTAHYDHMYVPYCSAHKHLVPPPPSPPAPRLF